MCAAPYRRDPPPSRATATSHGHDTGTFTRYIYILVGGGVQWWWWWVYVSVRVNTYPGAARSLRWASWEKTVPFAFRLGRAKEATSNTKRFNITIQEGSKRRLSDARLEWRGVSWRDAGLWLTNTTGCVWVPNERRTHRRNFGRRPFGSMLLVFSRSQSAATRYTSSGGSFFSSRPLKLVRTRATPLLPRHPLARLARTCRPPRTPPRTTCTTLLFPC